jgi:hypothetical protein
VTLRPLVWSDAQRVVSRPNGPIAAFATLVDDPDELDVLVGIEALTNPVAREAAGALATIPVLRRYFGPLAGLVMTPFVVPTVSRFSDGTRYGVLYVGDTIDTALREAGHHHALRLNATAAPAGTTVPAYSFSLHIDAVVDDVRKASGGEAALYDPDSYVASQAFGRSARDAGHKGLHYDSVRYDSGECAGLFWPDAILSARTGEEWRCYFDGRAITEYARVS